jgi:transcriptional regulator with XRE-family HTH domain
MRGPGVRYDTMNGMISLEQLKAARALLGWDQRQLAEASGVSLATIRRMEASSGHVRGNVDTLMRVVAAIERGGVQLIADGAASDAGGRGVRLRE